jgi:hypothetical protein
VNAADETMNVLACKDYHGFFDYDQQADIVLYKSPVKSDLPGAKASTQSSG